MIETLSSIALKMVAQSEDQILLRKELQLLGVFVSSPHTTFPRSGIARMLIKHRLNPSELRALESLVDRGVIRKQTLPYLGSIKETFMYSLPVEYMDEAQTVKSILTLFSQKSS